MFEKRKDLLKFLVVAKTGTMLAAADKLSVTQPSLSRIIAKLENEFDGQLFERTPTGVRLTKFGSVVADWSHHVLREIERAEEEINLTVSGQTGRLRVTAGPMWMKAVLPTAINKFHEIYPGIELELITTTYPEGLGLLINGESDLHCGGIDTNELLPRFLMRERILDMTWGIVAHKDHPLQAKASSYDELTDYPWIDFDKIMQKGPDGYGSTLTNEILDKLYKQTSKRAKTIIRTNSMDLSLIGTGPYLSVLSLNFLEKLPGSFLKPLSLQIGRFSFHTGILSRRETGSMAPYRHFKKIVRDVVLG